jgi:hypothetical protein
VVCIPRRGSVPHRDYVEKFKKYAEELKKYDWELKKYA